MPSNILDITKLDIKRTQQGGGQCVIVSLANGEIRLINPKDKNLIHILKSEVSTRLFFKWIGISEWSSVWNLWKRRGLLDSQL